MTMSSEKVSAARRASGMTVEKAASICNVSKPSYISREKNPSTFRIAELESLYSEMTDTAKPILRDAVVDIFFASRYELNASITAH